MLNISLLLSLIYFVSLFKNIRIITNLIKKDKIIEVHES